MHLAPALLQAATRLGLRSLAEHCERRLGDSAAARRWRTFAEVRRRNAAGERLLILDGAVFDVTRWLPEHPGGDAIIPAQALDLDCSRYFEVYHASRESCVYLREFYVGEIVARDLPSVPLPPEEPSEDFLRQLREFTADFRLAPGEGEPPAEDDEEVKAFKSF